MEFIAVTTRPLRPPQDDLYRLLDDHLPSLEERDVVLVTSKVVAVHQGRCVEIGSASKDQLIRREADRALPRHGFPGGSVVLTIKGHTLIPSAGVDESNGDGYYVLWPDDPNGAARELREHLCRRFDLHDLGVIVTDSHCVPLRRGVVGVAIGAAGLQPLRDYVGKPDIFGRPLTVTKVNVADALAAIGVFLMEEGSERTPVVIARSVPHLVFTAADAWPELVIPATEDIFAPLLRPFYEQPGSKS
jgi:coenzyme F420-0:L-glutamate ligase